MALRGNRNLVVHFEGKWSKYSRKYSGGKRVVLKNIDGDELCFMDLVNGIEKYTALKGMDIKWVKDGILWTIKNNAEVTDMWDNLIEDFGECHLYLENSNVPSTFIPLKKLPQTSQRKSPRFNVEANSKIPQKNKPYYFKHEKII